MFPEKLAKLAAVTQEPLSWGQENADNWSYYRWILLDEYPIVFGGLVVLFVYCLLKNAKVGLFLCCAFFVPFVMHSIVLPMKSYRYILYILPFMYMAAGVGCVELFRSLWLGGHTLNKAEYFPQKPWRWFLVLVLLATTLGTLINMPWFMRTLKDYAQGFEAPHVSDVQHHNWKEAVDFMSEHKREGDVIVSGYPLLIRHYGATQPLYFMNNAYLLTNEKRNLKDKQGRLIDYTFGVPILRNLDDLKDILNTHSSGWIITYQWRKDRFWNYPDAPGTSLGTFPREILQYIEDNLEPQNIPRAPYIALWRWDS